VCGNSAGIYYKAVPPYKCGDCLYKEKCPDEKLRAFAESLEQANNGWGHMSAESFYTAIDAFIKVNEPKMVDDTERTRQRAFERFNEAMQPDEPKEDR
jgi:hypothetical protein